MRYFDGKIILKSNDFINVNSVDTFFLYGLAQPYFFIGGELPGGGGVVATEYILNTSTL